MGQKLGKCSIQTGCIKFVSLPKHCMDILWQELNVISEGFCIRLDEFTEICYCLKDQLNVNSDEMNKISTKLFYMLDTDQNGIIDSLEFFGALIGLSGMNTRDKLTAILKCYDFDGTEYLALDEIVLALKCVTTGLSKLTMELPPRESELENLLIPVYKNDPNVKIKKDDSMNRVRISSLIDFLVVHADISTWIAYYVDIKINNNNNNNNKDDNNKDDNKDDNKASNNITITSSVQDSIERIIDNYNDSSSFTAASKWDIHLEYTTDNKKVINDINSWQAGCARLEPLNQANTTFKANPPDASLEINWVYGYEGTTCRHNVHYLYQGDIIYSVGRYAVIYSIINKKQSCFACHMFDISALTLHPDRKIVATSDSDTNSRVIVWNSEDKKILFADRMIGSNGTYLLTFSYDGKLLCALGNDQNHSLVVYNWAIKEVVMTSTTGRNPGLCCTFTNDSALVVGGDSYIFFWEKASTGYTKHRGIFPPNHESIQTSVCSIGNASSVISGTSKGTILLWTGRSCIKHIQAHDAAVNCLYSSSQHIVSACEDSLIKMWSHRLEMHASHNANIFPSNSAVRSLCVSKDASTILFGTLGCNICEISALDGANIHMQPLVSSHSFGSINAITTHPTESLFFTAGDDGVVRKWSLEHHGLISEIDNGDNTVTSLSSAVLDNQVLIAAGFGGSTVGDKCGAFTIYDENLDIFFEALVEKGVTLVPVSLVKFSQDAEKLAVGYSDGSISIFALGVDEKDQSVTTKEYELISNCVKHELPIDSVDFSIEAEYIRSNSIAKDLAFFSADDGSLVENYQSMRDVEWETATCLYTWHSKNCHRSIYNDEEITAIDAPRKEVKTTIVSGTNFGFVRLHAFPCVHEDSEFHRYFAHTGQVNKIAYTPDSKYLFSIGKHDKCIIQWLSHEYNDLEPEIFPDDLESDDYVNETLSGTNLLDRFLPESSTAPVSLIKYTKKGRDLPWKKNCIPPSNAPENSKQVPSISLRLEHVFGYNTMGMRNNVRYNCNSDIVYPCAALGIVQKRSTGAQIMFAEHEGDICSIAVSNDGLYVASVEHNRNAHVMIWDAKDGSLIKTMMETQKSGASSLVFSSCSRYLAIAGLDADHTISYYDWRSEVLISRGHGGGHHIFQIALSSSSDKLLTCGVKDIRIWNITNTAASYVRPSYGEFVEPVEEIENKEEDENAEPTPPVPLGHAQAFLCCTYLKDLPVIGTADGNLYVFEHDILMRKIEAHEGGVNSIYTSTSQGHPLLVTGGKDGSIIVWNDSIEKRDIYYIKDYISTLNVKIQSVTLNKDESKILVGLRSADIIEINRDMNQIALIENSDATDDNANKNTETKTSNEIDNTTTENVTTTTTTTTTTEVGSKKKKDKKSNKAKTLVRGHFNTSLWGICAHPFEEEFVSAGYDGMLHKWDYRKRSVVNSLNLDAAAQCIAYSSDGALIVVGYGSDSITNVKTQNGSYLVLSSADFKKVHEGRDCKESIRCVRFSPNSEILAIGSDDSNYYLYSVNDTFSLQLTMTHHKAPVIAIDFSSDGQYIVSSDSTQVLMYTHVKTGQNITAVQDLRDVSWASISSTVVWASQGTWDIQQSDVEPTTVVASRNSHLLAVGTSSGHVQVCNNPILKAGGFLDQGGHGGAVGSISWAVNDEYILSTGSSDRSIFLWKVNVDNEVDEAAEAEGTLNNMIKQDCGMGIASIKGASSSSTAMAITIPKELRKKDIPEDLNVEFNYMSGVRLSDCRQCLKYNSFGSIVYFASNVGIVYTRDSADQVLYSGHKQAIISLDVDKSGNLATTGDKGTMASVHVWNACTCVGLICFENVHQNGVASVTFSESGTSMVSLGQEAIQTLIIYTSPSGRWWDGYVASSCQVSSSKCIFVKYIDSNPHPIVVGGDKFLYFFRKQGRGIERKRGIFGKGQKKSILTCAVAGEAIEGAGFGSKSIIIGTSTGLIQKWVSHHMKKCMNGHTGAVTAITNFRNSHGFVTAGADGIIKSWNYNFQEQQRFDNRAFVPKPYIYACHALQINLNNSSILAGMKGGEVYEMSISTGSHVSIIESHSEKELHGYAFNPSNNDEYATVGDDSMVCVWRISGKKCLRKASLDAPARAIAYSNDGLQLAIGLGDGNCSKDGAFMMLDSKTLEILFEDRKSKLPIHAIKYLPNNDIAFRSADGKLYVHSSEHPFKLQRTIMLADIRSAKGGTSNYNFDISKDCKLLRFISDSTGNLNYVNMQSGSIIEDGVNYSQDMFWDTFECSFGPQSELIERTAENDGLGRVICMDVKPAIGKIAVCFAKGAVRVYKYPCIELQNENEGQSSATLTYVSLNFTPFGAARVTFSPDGQYLLVLEPRCRSIYHYLLHQNHK